MFIESEIRPEMAELDGFKHTDGQILGNNYIQRVPALRAFWDLEKTVLHEIRVSGTVGGPLLTRKSPTCTYISQKPW